MTHDRTSGRVRTNSGGGASTLDLSGRRVGSSYILLRPIGQGATGTVWEGRDEASGDPVAIKLLHESLLRQPKLVTRFVQERTILLMLRHRNVVRVRDLFSVGETLGLVMDLVEGGSLRDHLRRHRTVAAGEAARLGAEIAAALAEAHELGVVHRDLKPDNVLLLQDEDGWLETRLTDFGVARILNTPSMTTPNAVVGTPHYMSPEAFHSSTASPATDVYAMGVLLYELVCGLPPYDSDSIPDLMRRHMEGRPERAPGIPDPIWDVIGECLSQKPRLRPTAAELAADLAAIAAKLADVPALPAPRGGEVDLSLGGPSVPEMADPETARPGVVRQASRARHGRPEDDSSVGEDSLCRPVMSDDPYEDPLALMKHGSLAESLAAARSPIPSQEKAAQEKAAQERDTQGKAGQGKVADEKAAAKEPEDPWAGADPLPEITRRPPRRRNRVPSLRWSRPGSHRPGAGLTAIIGGMLAAAVAASLWQLGHGSTGVDRAPAKPVPSVVASVAVKPKPAKVVPRVSARVARQESAAPAATRRATHAAPVGQKGTRDGPPHRHRHSAPRARATEDPLSGWIRSCLDGPSVGAADCGPWSGFGSGGQAYPEQGYPRQGYRGHRSW